MQTTLFQSTSSTPPLAAQMRPKDFEHFVGQTKVIQELKTISQRRPHFIFYGPPGSGKTTLALLLGKEWGAKVYEFNAVLSGVPELKRLIEEMGFATGEKILFIDEIHRFNKSQQDALLPFLEDKKFHFIGATTEYPQTSLNPALLSRVRVLKLLPHSEQDLQVILKRSLDENNRADLYPFIEQIAHLSDGDARMALNTIALLLETPPQQLKNPDLIPTLFSHGRKFDRKGDRHYNVISAFIKSIRGSDPDSALLWLAVMIDGGEDPEFIARRLMILASEDIGLANSQALQVACHAHYVTKNIGLPEARITLAHATVFLALSPKSHSAYLAIDKALEYVKSHPTIAVPPHLTAQGKSDYLYPHSYPKHFVDQDYGVASKTFFEAGSMGSEKTLHQQWLEMKK